MSGRSIVVYGAAGHTGGFVVRQLAARGFTPILAGRDASHRVGSAEMRVADASNPDELDRVLAGAVAVINCAGPFLDTARPLVEAAVRARVHYLDVSAEQAATRATLDDFARDAVAAGICVVPSVAFFGGLADLLATAALGSRDTVDGIEVAIALDRWAPTRGTLITGQRNIAPRVVVTGGELAPLAAPAPASRWRFPAPFGEQDMIEVPFSEIITMHRHLQAREIHTHLNVAPLADLRAPHPASPVPADESGRSAQRFVMEAVVRSGEERRIARATGRDIYAVTAPLVVEAIERILDGRARRTGTAVAGELFDARSFLEALGPEHLAFELA